MKSTCTRTGWLAAMLILVLVQPRIWAQTSPNYPAWWSTYGVISGTTRNDYAAVAQGQAKNLAVAAVSELNNALAQSGGAGSQLNNLATTLLSATATVQNLSAVNLG